MPIEPSINLFLVPILLINIQKSIKTKPNNTVTVVTADSNLSLRLLLRLFIIISNTNSGLALLVWCTS